MTSEENLSLHGVLGQDKHMVHSETGSCGLKLVVSSPDGY